MTAVCGGTPACLPWTQAPRHRFCQLPPQQGAPRPHPGTDTLTMGAHSCALLSPRILKAWLLGVGLGDHNALPIRAMMTVRAMMTSDLSAALSAVSQACLPEALFARIQAPYLRLI